MSEGTRPVKIGDYEIEGELGVGGMATVYRARHAILETAHAVKVLDPEYRANAEARKRFLDEAKIQAKHLDHPNIVKVTNIVATPEYAALVMELVEGTSLESVLPELAGDPAEIKRIMLAVLDAVGYAHTAGIIHRDLKPANVLLARKGSELVPKVTDFGIAKVTQADGKSPKKSTHVDARMGTLHYMSPEQVRRSKDVTPRSDVFSLGAMLFEMATGKVPFEGESDFDLMEAIVKGRYTLPDTVDPTLAAVIRTALAPDPANRFASCEEMAAALRGVRAPATPAASIERARPPVAPIEVTRVPATASRVPYVVFGMLVLAIVVVGFVMFGRGAPARREITTADELWAAELAATGGRERLTRHVTTKQTGTLIQNGETITFTYYGKRPNQRVMIYEVPGKGTFKESVTNGVAWTEDPSGVTRLSGKTAEEKLRDAEFGARFDWRERFAKADFAGRAEFRGTPAYKLVLTDKFDGTVKTRFYATDTFLELATQWSSPDKPGELITMVPSEYRVTDGITTARRVTREGGAWTLDFTIETNVFDDPSVFPPGIFDTPAAVTKERPPFDEAAVYAAPIADAPTIGPPDALVTIVEAFDYACPFCERTRPTIEAIRARYGRDVRIVHQPFIVHPIATASSLAACAAARQGTVAEMDAKLWDDGYKARRQDPVVGGTGWGKVENPEAQCWNAPASCEVVVGFARELGLDVARFVKDLKTCYPEITSAQHAFENLGVSGTPTFFINGRAFSGARQLEHFVEIIDRELAVAKQRVADGTPRGDYYRTWVLAKGLTRQ